MVLARSLVVSPESPWDELGRDAEDAASLVDLVDRQLDAGELGRAEEGEGARLGEERADA